MENQRINLIELSESIGMVNSSRGWGGTGEINFVLNFSIIEMKG